METTMKLTHIGQTPPRVRPAWPLALLAQAALLATNAAAVEIDTGNPDLKLRWDNTFKYSLAARVKDRSPGLSTTAFGPTGVVGPNNVNQDDGDNNFGRGLVSNRLDVLSELDLTARNYGARLSAAGWYDAVYNRSTDNASATANHFPASEFPDATRRIMGRKSEVLDAFVFGNFELAERSATVRAGRHTLLWGESLFFGSNGIAGGQAPLDLVKLLSVPNSTFKEIARPTGKVSGSLQLTESVSLGAYVGYEWQRTRLMPVGAYLSTSDTLDAGGERIIAGPNAAFLRAADITPGDTGQGGLQLRWHADGIDTDFGFYAIRYHASTPSNIYTGLTGVPPALAPSSYRWAYHEGIRAFGASFAKTINEWSLAGEVSYRQNAPLASAGQSELLSIGRTFDNRDNPGYAVGETAHLNFNWLASLGPSFIANEASFLGEIAWNARVRTTQNPQMLNPNATRSATALRMVYSPTYRQVAPGLDLTPSIGVGYGWGASSAVGPGFALNRGGDMNIGLGGVYLNNWFFNLSYVHFLGKEAPFLDNNSNAQYRQALKDRDFVTLSVRTTF
jgi:hypothetical protein